MNDLMLVDTRGGRIESRHRLTVAVVDADGNDIAGAGDRRHLTFWRSAAKPFQLWPLVQRGGVDRFQLSEEQLALACASHNGEEVHQQVAAAWLESLGLPLSALSCGGHRSLDPSVEREMVRSDAKFGPLRSNCCGNHAALLGLAVLEGWDTAGYQALEHPVQQAVAESISEWTDLAVGELHWGVDGCTAAAVATPIDRLALAYARLGSSQDSAAMMIRGAMTAHPYLVAGRGRLDTAIMSASPGEVLVKMGAEGVFAASLPPLGLGVALKVEDGDMRAATVAIVAVLDRLLERLAPERSTNLPDIDRWREPVIVNTRGEATGRTELQGELAFE